MKSVKQTLRELVPRTRHQELCVRGFKSSGDAAGLIHPAPQPAVVSLYGARYVTMLQHEFCQAEPYLCYKVRSEKLELYPFSASTSFDFIKIWKISVSCRT